MELTPLSIKGAWLAQSPVWKDDRGSFHEWFKGEDIKAATALDFGVQQANISISARGVVRGIHYSLAEAGQAKWITCVSGAIMDVIVDIRPKSMTYGEYVAVELIGGSGHAVLIDKDLGHGFVSLEEGSAVAYLVSSPFSPNEEFAINPLDPEIGIHWKIPKSELRFSSKDALAPLLSEMHEEGKLPK